MRRLVVAVLVGIGFTVTAVPAHAAVAVSIDASRSVLMAGTRTIISGAATNAKRGSVVRLQHRTSSGWLTIASKKLGSTHSYSFGVLPPRGYQFYRVLKPALLTQPRAVSATLKLTVRWNPNLTASATYGHTVTVVGKATDTSSSPVVAFEREDSVGWTVLQTRSVTAGVPFTFSQIAPTGPVYRVRLLPTPLTTGRVSPTFEFSAPTQTVAMNSTSIFQISASDGDAAVAKVLASDGDYVTVAIGTDHAATFRGTVTDQTGALVAQMPTSMNAAVARFVAPGTGVYTVTITDVATVSDQLALSLSVSTPKVVPTMLDSGVDANPDLPGQVVDVRFPVASSQPFTVPGNSTGTSSQVLDPSGKEVQPWIAGQGHRESIYTSSGGTYTYRLIPQGPTVGLTARPMAVHTVVGTVDGAVVDAVVDDPERVVLVEFDRPAAHVTVGYPSGYRSEVATFDAVTGQPNASGVGTSVVAVNSDVALLSGGDPSAGEFSLPIQLSTPYDVTSTIDGPLTPVDLAPSYTREIAIHVSATEGQIIAPDVMTSGYWGPGTLTDASGSAVPELLVSGIWRVPATGDYTFTFPTSGDWTGNVGIKGATETSLPGDGAPTTVSIDKPGAIVVAHVVIPPGTVVDSTLDQVSAGLGNTWSVDVYSPALTWPTGDAWQNSWAVPGTLPPIVVPEPGNLLVVVTAAQAGTLRLAFTPRS